MMLYDERYKKKRSVTIKSEEFKKHFNLDRCAHGETDEEQKSTVNNDVFISEPGVITIDMNDEEMDSINGLLNWYELSE